MLLLNMVGLLFSQETGKTINNPFQFEASYTGDNVNNLRGGIKSGSCYLGMANFHITFDTEKSGLWKGTQFYVNAANTHGDSPSSELLGDMQVASNIEAGNHTYLQELWVKQSLGNIEITAGLQDLNVEFATSENGSQFLNSSFGILPSISGNIPAPIFPLTSLGFTTKWNVSEKTSWLAAIYDGSPTNFDYNPYNIKWQFSSGDGILAITELQHNIEIKELAGTYKLGVYTHNHFVETKSVSNFPDSLNHTISGVYMYADQKIWQDTNKSIGVFAQLGYSPSKTCFNSSYFGLGVNIFGVFSKSQTDILGFAIAHENFTQDLGSETALELTYKRQITNNIFVQPDLQYIINPSGKSSNLNNCFAGTLRIGLSF
jgi:porin